MRFAMVHERMFKNIIGRGKEALREKRARI
jgi:hypothetical protein